MQIQHYVGVLSLNQSHRQAFLVTQWSRFLMTNEKAIWDLGKGIDGAYRYFLGQGLGENSPIAVQGIDFTYTGNRILYIAI